MVPSLHLIFLYFHWCTSVILPLCLFYPENLLPLSLTPSFSPLLFSCKAISFHISFHQPLPSNSLFHFVSFLSFFDPYLEPVFLPLFCLSPCWECIVILQHGRLRQSITQSRRDWKGLAQHSSDYPPLPPHSPPPLPLLLLPRTHSFISSLFPPPSISMPLLPPTHNQICPLNLHHTFTLSSVPLFSLQSPVKSSHSSFFLPLFHPQLMPSPFLLSVVFKLVTNSNTTNAFRWGKREKRRLEREETQEMIKIR